MKANVISKGSQPGYVSIERPENSWITGPESVVTIRYNTGVESPVQQVWDLFKGLLSAAARASFRKELANLADVPEDTLKM
jgi:hypothetical protein